MITDEELALWDEELHRAKTRVLLYKSGIKDWYIDGDKDVAHYLEYADNGEGFYDAHIYEKPALSQAYRCIGYARAVVVWEFTESVDFGIKKKRIDGKLRYRTHKEMQQEFAKFCETKGYYYRQRSPRLIGVI